jgi:hypothetical protein
MCEDAVGVFACADRHEERGEERERLKHINRCQTAIDSESGMACADRGRSHDWQDDDDTQDCPECRGETPPQTP